jgi:hypothetical protein
VFTAVQVLHTGRLRLLEDAELVNVILPMNKEAWNEVVKIWRSFKLLRAMPECIHTKKSALARSLPCSVAHFLEGGAQQQPAMMLHDRFLYECVLVELIGAIIPKKKKSGKVVNGRNARQKANRKCSQKLWITKT